MKEIQGLLIEGKLGRFISTNTYQIETPGFENFTAEAHLFALLEWSKYLRPGFTEKDRLSYLFEKCFDYDNITNQMHPKFVIIDTPFGYAVELETKSEDSLF
jgi:hypothetical protein